MLFLQGVHFNYFNVQKNLIIPPPPLGRQLHYYLRECGRPFFLNSNSPRAGAQIFKLAALLVQSHFDPAPRASVICAYTVAGVFPVPGSRSVS